MHLAFLRNLFYKSDDGHSISRQKKPFAQKHPRKDSILQPPSGWLETPLPLSQSLYGREGVSWRHNQNFSDR